MERVIVTVQDHGNTSTASVPLALDVGVRDGRIQARRSAAARSARRRRHLGLGAAALLTAVCADGKDKKKMAAIEPLLDAPATTDPRRWRWLPAVDSWKYHLLLGAIGILILGPLGGVTASYMNFSLGFFVGGQVLAGILGSTVTYGYGAEGKHGANYIQTTAASVAGMCAMAVVIQAMVWMGMPQPPVLYLVIYMLCVGMYGAGVGMLYTPILVDRLNLVYPSGLAVANILRALTDPDLLRRSVSTLGGGMLAGLLAGLGTARVAWLGATGLSMSTIGAGMVVGARVGVPAIVGGLTSWALTPYFVSIGWLRTGEPFRKITFLIALGMILGASIIDMTLILRDAVRRARQLSAEPASEVEPWKRTQLGRLVVWVVCWGAATVWAGTHLLGQPAMFLTVALAAGIRVRADQRNLGGPDGLESDFLGIRGHRAVDGCARPQGSHRRPDRRTATLLIAISVGGDMQQDRSTGRRLGYQPYDSVPLPGGGHRGRRAWCGGIRKLFMAAYPVLTQDQTVMSAAQQPAQWSSAMTYKFVGALRSLTVPQAISAYRRAGRSGTGAEHRECCASSSLPAAAIAPMCGAAAPRAPSTL